MNVNFKKADNSISTPKYAIDGDACIDLCAYKVIDETWSQIVYDTGIAIEIPEGYVGLVFPRSSIRKYQLQLSNSVGVIDSGYRDTIKATFNKLYRGFTFYNEGDRICQLMIIPYPKIDLVEVNELSSSERGLGGHGSTGD